MIFLYAGILIVFIALTLIFYSGQKEWIRTLNKKEHPFRLFYPLAAKLVELIQKILRKGSAAPVDRMLKSLYVKENIKEEKKAYQVKKAAMVISVIAGASLLGLILSLSRMGTESVRVLERNEPGGGTSSYELQVDYQGREDVIDLSVEEQHYEREEILSMFDEAIEGIKQEALGENEDAEHVNKPMKFLTERGQIQIFWRIEDTEILDYNGQIRAELEEDETELVNLFITLTLDEVSKSYNFPIVVTAPKLSDKEALIKQIEESIKESNEVYDKNVQLPKTLDGEKISFRKNETHNELAIFLLGLLAAAVIAFGLDRQLEGKVKKRKEQMMIDFSEIVSKLSLMYEAGSSILKAWEKIVAEREEKGGGRFAYQEMKLALEKIRSGERERDAYAEFGKRCGLHSYMKLGNILEQNLSKGTKGMKLLLKQEVEDAFEERKRIARKKGEEAGTKMLLPMVLMMVVVIVIVTVPALMSINL